MPKWRIIVFAIALSVPMIFGACAGLPNYTFIKQSSIDKAIATARVETQSQLETLSKQRTDALKQIIDTHVAREQSASDALFKSLVVVTTLKSPTRPEMVMGQSIQQTAAQLPPATALAQAKVFKDLQTELDETKVSTEVLKAQYEKELGVARAEGEAKTKALVELDTKVKTVEAEKAKVLGQALTTEKTLQAAKDEIQNKQLADKTREAEDAKHNEKVKMWLIGILLAAAAICGIGATFVPIPSLKKQLIVGSAICGVAGLAIPFITPWMVWCAVVVCLLPVVGWTIKTYHDEHADATDTYRALNELKSKSIEVFQKDIAPVLNDWHTNPSTAKRIDDRLKQVGDA